MTARPSYRQWWGGRPRKWILVPMEGSEMVEQLGGQDAAFLYCETPTMHLHVCGLLLLDTSTMPGGYSYDRICSVLFDRLPKIRSVRQKLVKTPLNLSRPYWIDDPDLDMGRHIHRVVLEPPGDDK